VSRQHQKLAARGRKPTQFDTMQPGVHVHLAVPKPLASNNDCPRRYPPNL
jgi:hypothetical protein